MVVRKDTSSSESKRCHFSGDLIAKSIDVPIHVFLFVPLPQREKGFYERRDTVLVTNEPI